MFDREVEVGRESARLRSAARRRPRKDRKVQTPGEGLPDRGVGVPEPLGARIRDSEAEGVGNQAAALLPLVRQRRRHRHRIPGRIRDRAQRRLRRHRRRRAALHVHRQLRDPGGADRLHRPRRRRVVEGAHRRRARTGRRRLHARLRRAGAPRNALPRRLERRADAQPLSRRLPARHARNPRAVRSRTPGPQDRLLHPQRLQRRTGQRGLRELQLPRR